MFLNTLTSNNRYPVQDYENLQLQIQMHLSLKRKSFSKLLVLFLEATSNFQNFEKEDDRYS